MPDLPSWQKAAIRRAYPVLDVWTLAECAGVHVSVILRALGLKKPPRPLAPPKPQRCNRLMPPSVWDEA